MFHEDDDQYSPTDDFKNRQSDRHHEADLGSMNDARGRVPMANGEIEGHRGRHDRKVKDQQRIRGQRECGAVIEHAMVFKALDLALLLSYLQTRWAEMLTVQLAVTQRAQKPPASFAG